MLPARKTIAVACSFGLLFGLPAVRASEPTHEALKDAAYAAFELGRYSEAIANFEAAYRERRDPRLLYNLALAYFRRFELAGNEADLRQARDLFRNFLLFVPAPKAGDPDRLKVLEARRFAAIYLDKVSRLLRDSTSGPPRTMPSPAASRPAPVQPAAHRTRPVDGEGSRGKRVARPSPRTPPERGSTWPWVLYGGAAAAGLAAGFTGGFAIAADKDSDQLAAAEDPRATGRADRARVLALSTDVLIGTALLSAAVGAIVHWRTHR